jgi:hypothetical protein
MSPSRFVTFGRSYTKSATKECGILANAYSEKMGGARGSAPPMLIPPVGKE